MSKSFKIFFDINRGTPCFNDAITIIDGRMDIAEIFHMQRIMLTMQELHKKTRENMLTCLEIFNLDDESTEVYMLDSTEYNEERNAILLHFKNKTYYKHYPDKIIVAATTEGLTHFLYDLVLEGKIWEEE